MNIHTSFLSKTVNNPNVHQVVVYLFKTEYYLAINKKGPLIPLTKYITKALHWVKNARHEWPHTTWFHLHEVSENVNLEGQKANQWLTEAEGEWSGLTIRGHEKTFVGEGNVLYHDYEVCDMNVRASDAAQWIWVYQHNKLYP